MVIQPQPQPQPPPPHPQVDMFSDVAAIIAGADPVVEIDTDADAGRTDNNGLELEGVVLTYSLLDTDGEGEESRQYGGFVLLEVSQLPAVVRADPNVAPEGDVLNHQIDARLNQLRNVQSHFTQWVRNSIQMAQIQELSPYECVVTLNGRLFTAYVSWEGA